MRRLINVINQLNHNPDSNICFCRNDLALVGGSRVGRKPNVAVVRYQSLEMLERSSVNNLMKDGPNGACFWWTELLLFFALMTAVVPSMSDFPVGTPPSQSASCKPSMPLKECTPQTMTTHSVSPPSPTSALESKCSSNATSLNSSHRSKRQKVDGAASNDLPMVQ